MNRLEIKKKSPSDKFWDLSIWNILNQIMVHHCDLSWNQIEASIVLMYEKLVRLGFTYYDGKIVVVEPDREGRNV